MARAVAARIPLRAFKQWLAERVDALSPAMTLIVFIVPVIPLFPLKLVGLWLLAQRILGPSAITTRRVREIPRPRRHSLHSVFDLTRTRKLLQMQLVRSAL